MRLRDAAKWIKEKITGKKTEETPVLTPMIATEEDIEKAKEIPMVRRQQLLRAERNQRRRRSENRKES